MARREVKERDLEEGSPDRLGESVEAAETKPQPPAPAPAPSPSPSGIVQAAMRHALSAEPLLNADQDKVAASPAPSQPENGTVVFDVEQGGIVVPSFVGKSVRAAIESAQENGLDLDAVGSGLGREQSPAPGTHVAAGSRITVKFGR